jgi:hypothetical protein
MAENDSNPYKATVYEKLTALASEIQDSVKYESTGPLAQTEAELERLRDRAYLERAPEAQHVTLLFRHYSGLVNRKAAGQGSATSNGGKNTNGGWWDHDITRDILSPKLLEGTGEVLVGMEATRTNAFAMRAIISMLAFISFITMVSCGYIHDTSLTPDDLFTDDCYMRTTAGFAPFKGYFNMTPYQWLIALSFFVFLHSSGFCVYYLLPLNTDNRKHIPGCFEWMERCLGKIGRDDVRESMSYGAKTATQRVSDFCHTHSKHVEWSVDGLLLALTLIICIICSMNVDRGAQFQFGNNPPQWYTLGTFHETFTSINPSCVTDKDPSDFIRAGLALLYISAFVQVLMLKVSRDSYNKFVSANSGSAADTSRDGAMPTPVKADAMQRRALMNSVDDEDVQVDL